MPNDLRLLLIRPVLTVGLVAAFLASAVVTAPGAMARPVEAHVQQIALADLPKLATAADAGALSGAAGEDGGTPELVTGVRETAPFTLVGLSWPADAAKADLVASVRVRTEGTWSPWEELEVMDVAPASTEESSVEFRTGTEPLATAPSDAVQVRVASSTGMLPAGMRLELIDPGASPADGAASSTPLASAHAAAAKPAIVSRAQWGANESYRNGAPGYSETIKAAVIHHTAGSNAYSTPAEAYAEVRGVYAYHTRSLGWSDIGYNFLVDKFGTIYEGRAGGIDKAVRGAHTGGFNVDTFGVSVLGDYDKAAATDAIVTSVAQVTAWKLGLHGRDPNGTARLTSQGGGTSRFPTGTTVTVDTIIAHRDVGRTACSGRYLYAKLDEIRSLVTSYGKVTTPTPVESDPPPQPQMTRLAGADRYETSVAQARTVHPESRTVVIVSGESGNLVDGLVAAPLAIQRRAPILLSHRDSLPATVAQEVMRRQATTVFLIGGAGALSPTIETQLAALGVSTVTRIAGPDRYSTAANVAREMAKNGVDDVAVLASGETANMIDALAVGGAAGATNRPILLTHPLRAPEVTLDTLEEIRAGVVVVVGGENAVSGAAARAVMSRLNLPESSFVRIAGPDRYDTATAIANAWAGKVSTDTVIFASGDRANIPDAISAGAHGKLTILTAPDALPATATDWLRSRKVGEALVVGGHNAVSDVAMAEIALAIKPR